ncbi:MAG: type II toxin-antitoxin system HicA family toxin [Gammaproteobacteria bacterium]|nr:type II toxin-antitoxin system HicA family toxin [Gammaproteobacteria bacterium]
MVQSWLNLDDSLPRFIASISCHPVKPGAVTIAGRMSKDLAPGTWKSILRQAGLDKEKHRDIRDRH